MQKGITSGTRPATGCVCGHTASAHYFSAVLGTHRCSMQAVTTYTDGYEEPSGRICPCENYTPATVATFRLGVR